MADKSTDSTQPEADVTTEGLTIVKPGARASIETEEVDRDDPPVADLARELPPEVKDAVHQEGTWDGDAGRHDGDDTQETSGELSPLQNDKDAGR